MPNIALTPSSVSSRAVISADRFKTQPQFEEVFEILFLVITNVPSGWKYFLWEVEADLPCIRKTYNPERRSLRLKIRPSDAHNCIAEWISAPISRCGTGFLNLVELDLLLLQAGTTLSCPDLRKEPDAFLYTPSQPFPTFIADV
ncbi:uncharacterized protein N7473_000234 [Penicillium subrubescens]|uniref:uncharacterized protein n=1 Tax=Penicillium subrubescens TaxID=1316194 RepID=UPI0025455A42|nr:uncharacterized protein N7473_000234 [Penicillium subrubescens]KAJ5910931.1 hypothetical protein N7473_000234 [Penicillium subrubescens]